MPDRSGSPAPVRSTAERISSISILAKFLAINTPTKISAGAVAHVGITPAIGLKNRHTAKQAAVTKLARPVLADEKEASDKVLNEDGEAITNYFAESDPASNTHVQDEVDKPKKKKKKEKKKQEKEEINIVKDLISLAIYILAIVAVCWLILTYVGQRTEVSGDSMNDTLHDGDSLWIDKLSYRFKDPERFDIVVFPYEEEDETYYIKRIIGLPGETVYIDEDGVIYINDEPLEENYGKEVIEENHRGLAAEAVTLGNDEYFVMGDNRNNSRDSRLSDVGNIHKDKFVGKAVFRFTGGFGFLNKEEQ